MNAKTSKEIARQIEEENEEFSEEKQIMARTFFKEGNGYVWSGYFHGKKRTLRISERMFESLRSVTNTDSKVINGDLVRDTLISLWKFENDVYDYQYTPSSSVPKIGDHQNSEEEKDRYNEIYTDNYTMFATNVIETEKFKSASPEERVILLEGARELAGFYAKKEWAAEFGLKATNKYGKVTYDPETATTASSVMFDGGIPIEKVSEILYGISELWPEKDAESVTYLQKWEYVMSVEGLDEVQQDSVLRAYMSKGQLERYTSAAKAGVRANAYVQIALKVDRLKPIRGNKGISDVQKWEVCVSSVKSEKQQDAMLKVYMSDEQYKTYSDLRKIGLSPTFYVK